MDTLLLALQAAPADSSLKFWAYSAFLLLVLVFLALDLGVFHRDAHEVSMKEAAGWSVVWITCGVLFAGVIYAAYEHQWLGLGNAETPTYNSPEAVAAGGELIVRAEVSGMEAAQQYLVGYVVEKSLALDNIFVIALIFSFFAIPGKYQHRVLFWGILGALVLRGGMIFIGAGFIVKYQWILIFFGLFLIATAIKMALIRGETDPSANIVVRLARRWLPLVPFYDGQRFLTRRTVAPTYSLDPRTGKEVQDPPPEGTLSARHAMTPLMLALILVEVTDLVFAVDSIPAIFAITPDPFIVLTSNVFAMLGLRSLYFCLAALIARFRYLKPGLIVILAFVGVKLLLLSVPPYLDELGAMVGMELRERSPIKIGTGVSMGVILGTLGAAIAASIFHPVGVKQEASRAA